MSTTILASSSVISECAHFYCCCRGDSAGRARGWIRTQMVTAAAIEAVDVYGATPDSKELDQLVRSARYQSKRFRKAVGLRNKVLISEADFYKIDRACELALQKLGTYILDAVAYSGQELTCGLHQHNGSWSLPSRVA